VLHRPPRPQRRQALQRLAAGLLAAPALGRAAPHQGLLVWINGDKGYEGIARIGAQFTQDTGVPLRVEHPEDAVSKFEQAAAAGKGPDIWIWPHDRAGGWARSGLISPVAPSRTLRQAIEPLAWQAWQMQGRTWGYPLAIEAVALIVNRALVATPPRSWDEVIAQHRRLQARGLGAIMWPYNEFFYTYGLASADGGYAFARRPDGSYDAADTGINHPGTRRGMALLKRLVDEGLIPRTASYAESEAAINQGRVAMTINGPWSWNNLRKSGLDVVAAPLPAVSPGGGPGRPMVGVLGAMLSASSRQPVLATEFIERYLLSLPGLRAMNEHVPLGVPANLALLDQVRRADPLIAGSHAAALAGQLMPNLPEMARFWTAMNAAVQNITQGREAVDAGLARAERRVLGAA